VDPNANWKILHFSDGEFKFVSKRDMSNMPFVVVASDGTGDYTSIKDAIDAAPSSLTVPTWIVVKESSTTYDDSAAGGIELFGKAIVVMSGSAQTFDEVGNVGTQAAPLWSIGTQGFKSTGGTGYINLIGMNITSSGSAICNQTNPPTIFAENCTLEAIFGTGMAFFHARQCKIQTVFSATIGVNSAANNLVMEDCEITSVLMANGITVNLNVNPINWMFKRCNINQGSASAAFQFGATAISANYILEFSKCKLQSTTGVITFTTPRTLNRISITDCWGDIAGLTFAFGSSGAASVNLAGNNLSLTAIISTESVGAQNNVLEIQGIYKSIATATDATHIDATLNQRGISSGTALTITGDYCLATVNVIPGTTTTGVSLGAASNNNVVVAPNIPNCATPSSDSGTANRIITATADGFSLTKTLTNAHIFVGNGSNVATDVAVTGDVTISNAGVTTIKNDVALAGNPTTTTQTAGNNSTRIATTAYVDQSFVSGAWTGYTPVITQSGTVTFTTSYAKSVTNGKMRTVSVLLAVTGSGTTNNKITVTLPAGATTGIANQVYGHGQVTLAGTVYGVTVREDSNGAATVHFSRDDTNPTDTLGKDPNAALASGDSISFTIVYELT